MNNTDKIQQASKRIGTSHKRAIALAKKYYGTTNLSTLKPYQIDKIVSWLTNTTVNKGKLKGRTYGRYIKDQL